ncbi:MAG: co-chaperone DjlA [Aestuariibacter sp.]
MAIWGKVLGGLFGFMFGRIPGAILGVVIGHMFDRGYSQDFNKMGGFGRFFVDKNELKNQAVFFHALFSVLGHIAKADGRVTEDEIKVASRLMDEMGLEGDTRAEAQQAFREGKAADFPFKSILKDLNESCYGRKDILQIYLEILIQAAFADGKLDQKEQAVLEEVAKILGFKQNELLFLISSFEAEVRFRQAWQAKGGPRQKGQRQQYQQRSQSYSQAQSLDDAYRILGVSKSDDATVIKKAYRKLMSEHHPDKLMSKGLPKQAMEIAKTKAQDIQAAYEYIKKEKGF